MGTESATYHSFVSLLDLAVLYARHARYGMSLDCVLRAISVAARMERGDLHADAMALHACVTLASTSVMGVRA